MELKKLENKKNNPLKSKTKGFSKYNSGRNNAGRTTMYHLGGRHKRSFRYVSHLSLKKVALVESLEYDPNRNALLARLFSMDEKKHFYILATEHLKIGQLLNFDQSTEVKLGRRSPLENLPIGCFIHSLGTKYRPETGVLQRSGGTFAQLIQKNDISCIVKLSSGEFKTLLLKTSATIGSVSCRINNNKRIGKAGRNRWLGIRPKTRGVAMNPVDHPHGGGEGKSSGGRPSVTPWARPAHCRKTKKKVVV